MSISNINQINDYENNPPKQDLTNQIDDIISKYRNQLAQLKTYSSKNNNNNYIYSPMQPKKINNEISPNLSKEIQDDNIKLQSLLTEEKLKTTKLKAQLENYEQELNKEKQ